MGGHCYEEYALMRRIMSNVTLFEREAMEKEIFLSNLKNFLKSVVCDRLFEEVSDTAKKELEREIEEFIRENAEQYSIRELSEIFISAQAAIGLFMEYRDASLLLSEAKDPNSRCRTVCACDSAAKEPLSICGKEEGRPRDWFEPTVGMLFVWVPGGTFQMGSGHWDEQGLPDEKPVHEVRLFGFWIGKFAVTVAQYMKFVQETDTHYPQWLEKDCKHHIVTGSDDSYKKLGKALIGGTYPIVGVSWIDAMAYSKWLSELTGSAFSLPSEAEWEYAARSGGKFEKYSGGRPVDQVAWYFDNSSGAPHPVGTKIPNGLGIYNMCGNVSEWCLDIYSRFAYTIHDHSNPVHTGQGSSRVVRGGSYNYGARDVRCTDRSHFVPEVRTNDLGFRLVMKKKQ